MKKARRPVRGGADSARKSTAAPAGNDLLRRGVQAFREGRYAEAERIMQNLLATNPSVPDALHILGLLSVKAGRLEEGERLLRRCVAAAPTYTDAHNNLGNALMARGQVAKAEASYARAVELKPDYPISHYNLGNALRAQGRLDDAALAYRRAVKLDPGYTGARINLANLLCEQQIYDEAEDLYRDVLERSPDMADVRLNLGNVHRLRGDLQQARSQYEALLAAAPDNARGRLSLALICLEERDLDGAARLIEQVQDSGGAPKSEVLAARAAFFTQLGDFQAAAEALQESLKSGANRPEYWVKLADLFAEMGHRDRAVEVLQDGVSRFVGRPSALLGRLVLNQRHLCDWRHLDERVETLVQRVRSGDAAAVLPFFAMSLSDFSPAELLDVARAHGRRFRDWERRGPVAISREGDTPDRRLRIGYVSGDFREHPSSYLAVSAFELHDRDCFEIFAYAIGPPDDSPMRRRLSAAFDQFVDVQGMTHEGAARRIAEDEIDILVDLQGYTRFARTEIFAMRPAPIQVSWLGFAGTMGVSFIDYLVADPVVAPPQDASCYEEALAYLPNCYAPVDFRREVSPSPTRAAVGLPEDAFVYCSFNNPYKLTPEILDCWCTLLAEVPKSVLWLYADSDLQRENIGREAKLRGLSEERVVFARKIGQSEHLARLSLADLFLDSPPYGAHTTASDALWAGVPLVTCSGQTFPSRVAGSVLTAGCLPELICENLTEYRALARSLATDSIRMAQLRGRTAEARVSAPLFDTRRFVRDLESLYRRMWARHLAGSRPDVLNCDA
ncbi:MAG: tetratricopeptide repeat protein [Thiohalocapsa sp.]|nr:tetratricopeptide repeat protein [Thiohalocapsa sp.]MCF7992104.1 tetratricopeptide repeat protein [Thiohalocapsa sp.]